jgi:predicted esterase
MAAVLEARGFWFGLCLVAGCGGDGPALDDAGTPDAGSTASDAGTGDSPCTITADSARCTSRDVVRLSDNGADERRVYWALPASAPPADGYPSVVLYQGSLYGPSMSWDVDLPASTPFGGYYQVALIASLVDSGFAVIQPEASGGLYWLTNTGGNYDATKDAAFIPVLLEAMADGTFGDLDMDRLYATGISSGGYMTSRMAVSYPGKFRALAIQAASYATCLGPICNVPASLPDDHPPTLLLHGTQDTTVPISTAREYEAVLMSEGVEQRFIEDPTAAHQWLDVAPAEITAWFVDH